MLRRVSAEDFEHSGQVMKGPEERGLWFICHEYGIKEGAVTARYPCPDYEGKWRIYSPLEDSPSLFLKFARLYEEADFEGAVLDWCHKYGVLSSLDRWGRLGKKEKIPLAEFSQETKRAWIILTLYDSALRGDAKKIRSLLIEHRDEQFILSKLSMPIEGLLKTVPHPESFAEELSENELLNFAYYTSVQEANGTVKEMCYQSLIPSFNARRKGFVFAPTDVKREWRFTSLIGAMYLQLFWMIEAGGELTRCEWCGRIISHASTVPNGRKPRADKEHCDDACRQAKSRSRRRNNKRS